MRRIRRKMVIFTHFSYLWKKAAWSWIFLEPIMDFLTEPSSTLRKNAQICWAESFMVTYFLWMVGKARKSKIWCILLYVPKPRIFPKMCSTGRQKHYFWKLVSDSDSPFNFEHFSFSWLTQKVRRNFSLWGQTFFWNVFHNFFQHFENSCSKLRYGCRTSCCRPNSFITAKTSF